MLPPKLIVMLNYVFQYKFSILLAGIIAFLSLIPGSNMPDSSLFSINSLDKIVHFGMYASFGFVALFEIRCYNHCFLRHFLFLLGIFIMSVLIEVLQATVIASRSSEWLDLLANFTGLSAAYPAYRIIRQLRS